ncbi:hypothetical protein KP509_03G090800 [Ceratopteris richardii]|nr:hypothetical protein KP509_03G090800 [Ceratopteris richardii]
MPMQLIPDVELYRYDPWELPSLSPSSKYLHSSVDTFAVRQWFFFTSCDPKYSHGCRANRSTRSGYWKATGRDRLVLRAFPTSTSIPTLPSSHSHAFEKGHSSQPHAQLTSATDVSVNGDAGNEHGFKKTLVFYHGKPPRGTRTPWVMHEFYISSCASSSSASASSPPLLSTKPFSSSASASSPPLLSKKPTAWNKILLCRITRKMDQTAGRAEHTNERST